MKQKRLTGFDAHLEKLLRKTPTFAKEYFRELAELPVPTQLAIMRRNQGYTQSEVAKALGLKQSHVARTERAGHDSKFSSIVAQARAIHCRVMLVSDKCVSLVRGKPDYTEAELDQLERLAKARGGRSFKSVRAAKAYLKSL
jgi:transcriptional regulator with XRE-family HTH domain